MLPMQLVNQAVRRRRSVDMTLYLPLLFPPLLLLPWRVHRREELLPPLVVLLRFHRVQMSRSVFQLHAQLRLTVEYLPLLVLAR